MPFLIDGHNLIPKAGLRLDAPDDELELAAILQEFCRRTRGTAQVYFDGASGSQARTQRFGRLTAHFVRAGSSADAAIAAHVKRLGRAARNWTVVSSDRAVQQVARGAQAKILSSEAFAAQLEETPRSVPKRPGDRVLSSEEVSDWLKLFKKKD